MSEDDKPIEKSSRQAPLQKGMNRALGLMDRGMAQVRARTSKLEQVKLRKQLVGAEDDFAGEVREEDASTDPEKQRGASLIARREKKKKFRRKVSMYIGGFVLLCVIGWALFIPYKSGITYGVCHTFLQLQVAYPDHMRLSQVEKIGGSVRIWYVRVDPFGEDRMEAMRCYFRRMKEGEQIKYGNAPFVIDRVTRDRRPYDQAKVDAFNRSITTVIASNPDLVVPAPLPDSLEGLRFNFRAFRAIKLR